MATRPDIPKPDEYAYLEARVGSDNFRDEVRLIIDRRGKLLPSGTASYVNEDANAWLSNVTAYVAACEQERDELQRELDAIDAALARRPALYGCKTRADMVWKACDTAAALDRDIKTVTHRAEKSELELAELREQVRWIPVGERLPKEKQRVLILFKILPDTFEERFGEISCGHWRPEGGNGNFDDRVTHWRPLGPAPEKE